LGQRLYSGNNKVAWCGVTAPFDLLNAMGVTSCFVEFVGAMLATAGAAGPFLEEAEHSGYAADTCGYHRAVIGAAQKGLMPDPDFLIGTTCPCSGGLATLENLARIFKKDLFVLHIPQDNLDQSVRYLADQIKDMVKFVSDHTGEPLDLDRLRKNIENTNSARDMMAKTYALAQHVPSPTNGGDLSNFGIVMSLLFGTDEAIEIAQAYHDEFAGRIESGTSGVPGERVRLLWIQNRIQFKNPLVSLLEEKYKACVVTDELNSITWDAIDPNDPYPGLAQRAISTPFNGCIEKRISHLQKLAKEYRIDGAINPCHWGCRQGTGARGLIEEGLKEIGVPVLNLEVDCIDSRNFAEGQLKTRIEAFMEMLEDRKQCIT
jgi:benzoyl-CoA reductase/2-hydroxyglutaryl-CoA dehydratase subunit BcrC/BadD/HgdB